MRYVAGSLGVAAAIWLAAKAAGTDWSILYAAVLIAVTLFLIRRSA